MTSFPADVQFRASWREYQTRVLNELDSHLHNQRLHVVAAPGSGKTVLGLEVIRRLNLPALVLAPTRTIREQWIDRLAHLFLPEPRVPDWVSKDLRQPRLLTVATYQALHVAIAGKEEVEEDETEAPEESGADWTRVAEDTPVSVSGGGETDIISLLREAGVRVLIVDEAHHLRAEWWKSLTTMVESLDSPTVVALTATPPYDVHPTEWQRYERLCGPIDAEIPVPELVARGDLCPHQDYVYFSTPTTAESQRLTEFRANVAQFHLELLENSEFAAIVMAHPWLQNPESHLEDILADPAYASSLAIYLNTAGHNVPSRLLQVISVRRKRLPKADLEWMEVLLTGCLYYDAEHYSAARPLMQGLERRLRAIGALERRRVVLRNSTTSSKLLTASINKLQNITDIVKLEADSLGGNLKAVILADFIRRNELPHAENDRHEFARLGVVPIFESLRRARIPGVHLGILSGSLVVIPKSAAAELQSMARAAGLSDGLVLQELRHSDEFLSTGLTGTASPQIVGFVTRLFNEGRITVLVGTTSLLGEGWDAPSINTLILASGVGSYMFSNQMRGRAIRIDPNNAGKTSNVWHLVTVEPDWEPGADYEMLARRFCSFAGVAYSRRVIENGIERMEIGDPPFSRERLDQINEAMKVKARNRDVLRAAWKESLVSGTRLVEAVEAKQDNLPRRMVFANTLAALCWQGGTLGVYVFLEILRAGGRAFDSDPWLVLKGAAIVGAVVAAPYFLKATRLLVRHGTVERSLREVGRALLEALVYARAIESPRDALRVHAAPDGQGQVHCWLEGGTSFERSLFLIALREVLDPLENPRYLLIRRSRLLSVRREDFHAVPEILGRKKKYAEYFHRKWVRYVGAADLVFTRTVEGRGLLLRARTRAFAAGFQERSERRSCWK